MTAGCLNPFGAVTDSQDGGPLSDVSTDAGSGDATDLADRFEPTTPSTYVAKVKNILIGLPATDAEIEQVTNDPTALRGLIDGWIAQPQFESRAQDFFRNAFQQNGADIDTVFENHGQNPTFFMNNSYRAVLERTLMDSFAKTAWQLVQGGRPFTETITTDTYQLTTAQLVLLSYLDEMNASDTGKITNRLQARNAIVPAITFDPASKATIAQSVDPASASYMIWPDFAVAAPSCAPTKTSFATPLKYVTLFRHLFGYGTCANPTGIPSALSGVTFAPVLGDADFSDYHAVRIVQTSAAAPNTTPLFWNIPAMRTATTITLHTPRMGFAGTMAFASNWGTNAGNEARVTANQMLIVGIGRSINDDGTIAKFPVNATDAAHASDPACQGCHAQLDPMKQFIRQSWSLAYDDQLDATQLATPANFGIDGITASGTGVGDLTKILASHPRFALAWTAKLYFWATSRAADEADPELIRVAGVFSQSGFDWKVLVRELFSSPLVTYASATTTTSAAGDALSIGRRDQFCTMLSNRLAIADVCGTTSVMPTLKQKAIQSAATLIAADTYFRSYALPTLPTQPDLFFRASAEAVCTLVAAQVVDAGPISKYVSTDPTTAIEDLVTNVMALPPGDPRHAAAVQILTDHFAAAKTTTGATLTQALSSTFELACLSPTSVIVGL